MRLRLQGPHPRFSGPVCGPALEHRWKSLGVEENTWKRSTLLPGVTEFCLEALLALAVNNAAAFLQAVIACAARAFGRIGDNLLLSYLGSL